MGDLRPTMETKRDSGLRLGSVLCHMVDPKTVEGFAMAGAKDVAKFLNSTYSNLWSVLKDVCSSKDLEQRMWIY